MRFLVNPNTRRGSIFSQHFALSVRKDDNLNNMCLLLVFLSGKQEIDMTHYRRNWLKVLYVFVLIISLNCSTHKLHIYVHGTFSLLFILSLPTWRSETWCRTGFSLCLGSFDSSWALSLHWFWSMLLSLYLRYV